MAPLSDAVEVGGFVVVTGQMPDCPEAPGVLPWGIAAQTQAAMRDLGLVLGGIGLGLSHVVVTRISPTHVARDYAGFNALWPSFFAPGRLPARSSVGVTAPASGARVGIDRVARRPG